MTMTTLKIFTVLAVVFVLGTAHAQNAAAAKRPAKEFQCSPNNGTDLPLPKGLEIQVRGYDAPTDTFTVFSVKFPGEGDSFVTLDALAAASSKAEGLRSDIAKKPDDIQDERFTLDKKEMPTLFERERKARIGCSRTK